MDQTICGTCLFTPMFTDYHKDEVSFVYLIYIYAGHVSTYSKIMIARDMRYIFTRRVLAYLRYNSSSRSKDFNKRVLSWSAFLRKMLQNIYGKEKKFAYAQSLNRELIVFISGLYSLETDDRR